jgi:aspartate 1-decarboxylase
MRCSMLKGKIHRAVVTQADLHYEGSLTVDSSLLEAADILPFEEIHVWNVTRGSRLVTYAMAGEPGSGVICVNGAGAHLVQPGDVIIVAAFVALKRKQARKHKPRIVLLDEKNRIKTPISDASQKR